MFKQKAEQIHERYIVRHKILEILYNKMVNHRRIDDKNELDKSNMLFSELAEMVGLPYKKVRHYHLAMHSQESGDQIKCFNHNGYPCIGLEQPGVNAYLDEYWLTKGKKETLEMSQIESVIATNKMQRWSFWASLMTALAALAIGVTSLYKETPNIINPTIILRDTVMKYNKGKDTAQLQIRLHQVNDTSYIR